MFDKLGDFLQRFQAWLWAIGLAILGTGIVRGFVRDIPLVSLVLIGVGILVLTMGMAVSVRLPFSRLSSRKAASTTTNVNRTPGQETIRDLGSTFYPDRPTMNRTTGGLVKDLLGVEIAWAAWYTGVHAANEEVWANTAQPHVVVLLDPEREYIRGFAPLFLRQASELGAQIKTATRRALAAGAEVYWFNGPMISMLFGDPDSDDGWVRFELAIPFSPIRPNVVIRRRDYPALFGALKHNFTEMIRDDDHCRRMLAVPEDPTSGAPIQR